MCNFIKTVKITDFLSELVEHDGQQTLVVEVSDGHRFRLVSSGQEVAAYYDGNDGMCVVSCDPDLSKLKVGDTIVLGVAVPKDEDE